MVMKMSKSKEGEKKKEEEFLFDTDYLKKMLKFHKQVNDSDNILGVYISSPSIDKVGINIVKYMVQQFSEKYVNSPLKKPIIMLFDPELKGNRLDVKVSYCPKLIYFLDPEHPFDVLRRLPPLLGDALQVQHD